MHNFECVSKLSACNFGCRPHVFFFFLIVHSAFAAYFFSVAGTPSTDTSPTYQKASFKPFEPHVIPSLFTLVIVIGAQTA